MSISKVRGVLYTAAKLLGDVQAVEKAFRTKSGAPLVKRARNRVVGRAASRVLWGSMRRLDR